MYEAWPSNKIQKNFFFVFMIVSFFFLSSPRNKIRKNFFQALGLFDTHSSLILLPWFNPRVYLYPPSRHPVSSRFRHRRTASQTCRVPRFVPTRPRHVLRAFLLPFPIRRLFHLVSLLRHPYMSSTRSPCMRLPIVPRSWLSWVCQVSNAPGGLYAYPIFAFIYLSEGVCGYPLLPLLFMSAAFYLSAKFDVSISLCRVCSLSSPHCSRPVNRPLSPCFNFLYYVSTVSPLSSFHRVSPSFDVFLLYHRCRCRCWCYLASVFISLPSPSPIFVYGSFLLLLVMLVLGLVWSHGLFWSHGLSSGRSELDREKRPPVMNLGQGPVVYKSSPISRRSSLAVIKPVNGFFFHKSIAPAQPMAFFPVSILLGRVHDRMTAKRATP